MKRQILDRCDGVTTWEIFDDSAKSIGSMQSVVVDTNKTSRKNSWKVVGYIVELDNGLEGYFGIDEYGPAASALAAASKWANCHSD